MKEKQFSFLDEPEHSGLVKPEATGQELKERGMELSAMNRAEILSHAQALAVELAKENDGLCHMDMVRQALPEDIELGPAAGSVFKGDCWEFSGQRIRSTLPANHARELKVWRLK